MGSGVVASFGVCMWSDKLHLQCVCEAFFMVSVWHLCAAVYMLRGLGASQADSLLCYAMHDLHLRMCASMLPSSICSLSFLTDS
jgi:hypothetical protein